MKFAHVTEYNIRNIFLKKSTPKYGEETSLRQFSKKSKFSISRGQQSEILYSLFLLCVRV